MEKEPSSVRNVHVAMKLIIHVLNYSTVNPNEIVGAADEMRFLCRIYVECRIDGE